MRFVMLWFIVFIGCNAQVPIPKSNAGNTETIAADPIQIKTLPLASLDNVPPVVHIRILESTPMDMDWIFLFQGELSDGHLSQLKRMDISNALSERIVESNLWREWDEHGSAWIVLAPAIALSLGATYSVASGNPEFSKSFRVSVIDFRPTLERLWPPHEQAKSAHYALYCGEQEIEQFQPVQMKCGMSDMEGTFSNYGENPGSCIQLELNEEMSAGSKCVVSPVVEVNTGSFVLDPMPLEQKNLGNAATSLSCNDNEVQFGLGCARILDDRVVGRAPDSPISWLLNSEGVNAVWVTSSGEEFVVKGFSPFGMTRVDIENIDLNGNKMVNEHEIVFGSPSSHLVINEVYANPVGSEPEQEWIELYNDGMMDARLNEYSLVDTGGEIQLPPDTVVPPSTFVLLVNEGFQSDNGFDPVPSDQAMVVVVSKLGTNGLSNAGEPMKLMDFNGELISSFSGSKSDTGKSISRRMPETPDNASCVWGETTPTPGASNHEISCL